MLLNHKLLLISESPLWKRSLIEHIAEVTYSEYPVERMFNKDGEIENAYLYEGETEEVGRFIVMSLPTKVPLQQVPIEFGSTPIMPIFFFQQSRDITTSLKLFKDSLEYLMKSTQSRQCIVFLGIFIGSGADGMKDRLLGISEAFNFKILFLKAKATEYDRVWSQVKVNLEFKAQAQEKPVEKAPLPIKITEIEIPAPKVVEKIKPEPSKPEPAKSEQPKKVLAETEAPLLPLVTEIELKQADQAPINTARIGAGLKILMTLDGAVGCLVADYNSGVVLAKAGGGNDFEQTAAGNGKVLKLKLETMDKLGIKDSVEDILITLGSHYHLIRPITIKQGLFLYIVLNMSKANLALARIKLLAVEKAMKV